MKLAMLGIALICAAVLPCSAAVHKCTDASGKVTYTDEPCRETPRQAAVDTTDAVNPRPGNAAAKGAVPGASGTITSSLPEGSDADYRNAKGAWRGPAQFHVVVNGARAADAHAIAPMVIELQPDGRVQGAINDAGCKLSGLTTQFISAMVASVDVTLSGCKDARFNGRFNGFLNTSPESRAAKLQLNALALNTAPGKSTQSSIDAVLKR